MNDVLAIVVTYKRKDSLSKVLTSLSHQTKKPNKILVIDNDSNDGTERLVNSFSELDSDIKYYNTGGNLGGAGGFAFGFEVAEQFAYKYLWLMDDDLVPQSNCLENLLMTKSVGIVQPIRFNLDGSCAEISPVDFNLTNPLLISPKTKTVKDLYDNNLRGLIAIDGIPFEGPLIHRDVIDKVGYPNKEFFIFNDDLDYALRAKNHGFSIYCDTNSQATRLFYNDQATDLTSWKGYFMLRNHFHILQQHGKNILVRNKPIILTIGYSVLSFLKLDFAMVKRVMCAYSDSFRLSNTHKYKP